MGTGPAGTGGDPLVEDLAGLAQPDDRRFLLAHQVVQPADILGDPALDPVDRLGHGVCRLQTLHHGQRFFVSGHGRGSIPYPLQQFSVRADGARQVQLDRVVGVRLLAEYAADVDRLPEHVQGSRGVADAEGEPPQFLVGAAERRPRFLVLPILEKSLELAVEIRRAAEQFGTQRLELLLFEQQVFADITMEQLDRLHGQVEPLMLPDVGGLQLVVGPGHVLVGLLELEVGLDDACIGRGQGVVGPFQLAIGPGLDAGDGAQPDQGHEHGGAGRRDRRCGGVSTNAPASGSMAPSRR